MRLRKEVIACRARGRGGFPNGGRLRKRKRTEERHFDSTYDRSLSEAGKEMPRLWGADEI
jgi:hypothetical protein